MDFAELSRSAAGPTVVILRGIKPRGVLTVQKYVCDVCGYVYDPEQGDPDNGVAPGTAWEDVPDDWVCPDCGVGKDQFSPADE